MYYEFKEEDWKIYKEKIAFWQERYMAKLLEEYKVIIDSSGNASTRFWLLEKRINNDKFCSGVIIEKRRRMMFEQLVDLLDNNVITFEELSIFSLDLQESLKSYFREN